MEAGNKTTEAVRRRYDRIAPVYDLLEALAERCWFAEWRGILWSKVEGERILEAGVGTGKNFSYYPAGAAVTAIDFSEKMLSRARKKAAREGVRIDLRLMDVQNLAFADNSFDAAASAFVFCSVPDPIRGLMELKRVVKPGGRVILLEHVLSKNKTAARLMNLMNPLMVRLVGANINRQTVDNVARSGLAVLQVTDLAAGIVKLIEAGKS